MLLFIAFCQCLNLCWFSSWPLYLIFYFYLWHSNLLRRDHIIHRIYILTFHSSLKLIIFTITHLYKKTVPIKQTFLQSLLLNIFSQFQCKINFIIIPKTPHNMFMILTKKWTISQRYFNSKQVIYLRFLILKWNLIRRW